MLDSMIRNPRPTRAEVSDIANAVFELASCVMLSGETASGKYPTESLRVMVDTLDAAEGAMDYWRRFTSLAPQPDGTISGAIGHSCCVTAMDLGARAILASTTSGYTAKVISRYKPGCDIVALTTSDAVRRQLSLYWGVRSYLTEPVDSTDKLFEMCARRAAGAGAVQVGDTAIITAGVPVGISGTTNLMKAEVIG
jgi:pyruvate kinase